MRSLEEISKIIREKDKANARKVLMRLLQREPDDILAWKFLALVMNDIPKQIDCYRQVLRLEPEDQQAKAKLQELIKQKTLTPQLPETEAPSDFEELCELLAGKDLENLDEETLKELSNRGFAPFSIKQEETITQKQTAPSVSDEKREETPDANPPDELPDLETPLQPSEEVKNTEELAQLKEEEVSPDEPLMDPARWGDPYYIKEITDKVPETTSGPVPPEERIRCPNCNAAASIHEKKCQWCGTRLKQTK